MIPGQGTKIPHASWSIKQNRSNIVTNSIKTLKMAHIKKALKKKKFCLNEASELIGINRKNER